MFKKGDVVKVVDARAGGRNGPAEHGREVPYYKERLGKEFIIDDFDKNCMCFCTEGGDSFYPWRLVPVDFSLENE